MRPALQTTIRRPNGEPDPDADVYVYLRGIVFEYATYTAATGGSLITQPISPDADGNVTVYPATALQFDLKINYSDGTSVTRPIDLTNADSDGWTAPTFTNSWVNMGAGFENAGYMQDAFGVVHLKGAIKSGTLGSAAFTLPSGLRPAGTRYYSIRSLIGAARLAVASNGTVTPSGGLNNFMSLAGVSIPI